jgi:hypothetical protein
MKLRSTAAVIPSVDVSNVLNEEKKQQVIALGRLGWSLRRIERRTVRRETAATLSEGRGRSVATPGGWGRHDPKPATEVITDSAPEQPRGTPALDTVASKPANEVTTTLPESWPPIMS